MRKGGEDQKQKTVEALLFILVVIFQEANFRVEKAAIVTVLRIALKEIERMFL